ncbi:MAG: YbaB/EbfC family nucleoid-associated protein [Treponema sp.]|jgi:DNA-binding YbaB/EbfC family protein|nr:YbaB/EbfC family nucleoid-associated protein [Treponema sp.]
MQINPFEILKNMQKIQEQMGDMQRQFESVVVTGSSGGGMVEVELNGLVELQAIRIAPELVNDDGREILESLIVAAFEDARNRVKEAIGRKMGGLAYAQELSSIFTGMA